MRYHQHCRISQNHSHTLNDNILIGLENPCGRKDHHNAVNGHGQRHHRQKRICSKQKIEDRTFLQLSDFFGFSQFASRPFLILSKWKLVHQPNILIPVFDKRLYNAEKIYCFVQESADTEVSVVDAGICSTACSVSRMTRRCA